MGSREYFEKLKLEYPQLKERDQERLLVAMIDVPSRYRPFAWERILRSSPTAVAEELFFVQKWVFPNVFNWPDKVDGGEGRGVDCIDFPSAWAEKSTRTEKLVGWREKKNGVPYVNVGGMLVGDETVGLPENLQFVKAAERIGNDFFILRPYLKQGSWVSGELNFHAHPWLQDPVICRGEGVMLLMTDRREYRLKRVPTTEYEIDGMVMEVQMSVQEIAPFDYQIDLLPVAPRPYKAAKTRVEALSYLSRQVCFSQVEIRVEAHMDEMVPEVEVIQVRGSGDNVAISIDGHYDGVFENRLSVGISAKALIQDPVGNVLLVREGQKGWDLPGGKAVDVLEPPGQVLVREVKEEIGLDLPAGLKWKGIRKSPPHLGFLYHLVVASDVPISEDSRWFSMEEILSLSQTEVTSWFFPLLADSLLPGRPEILVVGRVNVLSQSNSGDTCYGTVHNDFGISTDVMGNYVVEGRYQHPVVPWTADVRMLVARNSTTAFLGNKVTQRAQGLLQDNWKLVKPVGTTDLNVLMALKSMLVEYDMSYFFLVRRYPRAVTYWNKPLMYHELILLESDSRLYRFHKGFYPKGVGDLSPMAPVLSRRLHPSPYYFSLRGGLLKEVPG